MSSASKFASGITIYFSTFFFSALPNLLLRVFFLKGESPSIDEKACRAVSFFLAIGYLVALRKAAKGPVDFLTG
jgi:hypothetical protein